MHEINYLDRSFNPESASDYTLSMQANSSGLSYCVYDTNSNHVILFRKHRFDQVILQSDLIRSINNVLESDITLDLNYSKIKFLAYTRQSTLVPGAFFDEKHLRDYLKFNDGETEGIVFSNLLSHPGFYNVFCLPDDLVSQVTLFFKKVEFLSQTTAFLQHILKRQDALLNQNVYVGLNPEFFDIACTGHGKLLLCNTFQYTSDTDLLYYILYVYNCLNLKPESVPLVLSGELSSKLSYIDILNQYFKGTRCDQQEGDAPLANGLKQLNTARFLNLLNVHACVSSAEYTGEER